MSKKNRRGKTRDAYTGEMVPEAEDAGKITEYEPYESHEQNKKPYQLYEETSMDYVAGNEDADAIARRTTRSADNPDTKDHFNKRQQLSMGGRHELEEELETYHGSSPDLSAGDLDASWQYGNAAGEETVGGSAATPEQNIVENLGKAAGLTYDDDEPLATGEKIEQRDKHRLDDASDQQES